MTASVRVPGSCCVSTTGFVVELQHALYCADRRISLIKPSGVKPSVLPTDAQIAAPRGNMRSWTVNKSTMSRGSLRP